MGRTRKTLSRKTVPGTWIVHYDGGAKAKAHRARMMGVHARRLAKRKQRLALAPALHARARVQLPKLVSSMVGRRNRTHGVYLSSGLLKWFPSRKSRRDFINANTRSIFWR